MSPPLSRRRSRRRSISRRLIATVVALVVLALLIGGITQISRHSGPYTTGADRSLAAQASVLANESRATGVQLRHLMADMQTLDRRSLQAALDVLVAQTAQQSALAQRAASPSADSSATAEVAATFNDRAQAAHDLRAAIDGLLGMHPLPVAGVAGQVATTTPTLLSATQATDRIAAAGALLVRADRAYRDLRGQLRRGPSRSHLPASLWVTNAQTWQLGAVADEVDLVAASPSLAVVHNLTLRTVRLNPPALPTPNAPAGTSVLSPTSTVSVTVVLSDVGSVDEPHAQVQFSLTPQGGGSSVNVSRRAAVPAGGSVTLGTVRFSVTPGHTYQLTVSIVLPGGQASVSGTSLSQLIQIAPGT